MKPAMMRAPRGFTMVELLLAISITVMTGAAAAAVSIAISRSVATINSQRSALLRAHLVASRLRAVTDPALCILAADPAQGIAVWLEDSRPNGMVNVSELRVFWFDGADKQINEEKIAFPAGQSDDWYATQDTVVAGSDDPFRIMLAERALHFTTMQAVGDAVGITGVSFDQPTARSSKRFRLETSVTTDHGDAVPLLEVLCVPNRRDPK